MKHQLHYLKGLGWILFGVFFLSLQGCTGADIADVMRETQDIRTEDKKRKAEERLAETEARKVEAEARKVEAEAREAELASRNTGTGNPTPPRIGDGTVLDQTLCYDSVQNKVAWDYKGSSKWSPTNVKRLCAGALTSSQPAHCFRKVMHGGVRWGSGSGGTKWKWQNAIDLCEGTKNSQTTIACFQRNIGQGKSWATAIKACESR